MVNLKNIDQKVLWYTVGIIVTDGSLSVDKRHIYITSKDEDLLVTLRNHLGLNVKIGKKSNGRTQEKIYSVLQFSDVNLYHFLENIGLFSNKSLTLNKIDVPERHFKDFVRGVIDGDGSIMTWQHASNGHMQWALKITSGAPVFASWLHEQMVKYYKVKGKIYTYQYKDKKNPIHIIKFGKVATKIILTESYYPECIALERKKRKAEECLRSENGWSKYGTMKNMPGCWNGRQARLKID